MTSNQEVFNIYQVDHTLNKPVQYKVSVFMTNEKIQSITSFFITSNDKGSDTFLVFGDSINQTWAA
jgi:hypothetical protein